MDRPALRKALGQHHLKNPELCRPLVRFLEPDGRRVLEIGPGGGVLTRALREAGARVDGWELDPAWAFRVARRFAGDGGVRFVVGDALELPWDRLERPVRVAGNLPYNVATVLIDRLLDHRRAFDRAGFLVQLEVAQRLVAEPGGKAYGALSVLTRARADARILARVKPGSFDPPPKVDSAFVGIVPAAGPVPARAVEALRALVYAAFGQRRKTLRNALSVRWPRDRVEAAIVAAGLRPDARAEQLSLGDFTALLNRLGSV